MSSTSRARGSGQKETISVGTQRAPKMRNVGNQTPLAGEVVRWPEVREPLVDDITPSPSKPGTREDRHTSIPPERNYVLRPMDQSIAQRSDQKSRGKDGRSHLRDDPTGTPLADTVDPTDAAQSENRSRALWREKHSTPNGGHIGGIRPLPTPSSMPVDSDNQSPDDSRYESRNKRSDDRRGKENKSRKLQTDTIYDHPSSPYDNPADRSRNPRVNNELVTSTPARERSSALHKKNYLLRPTSNDTNSPLNGVRKDQIIPSPVVTTNKKPDKDPSPYDIPSPSPQHDIPKKGLTHEPSLILGNVINSSRIYVHPTKLSPEDDPYTYERSEMDDHSAWRETQSFVTQPLNHNDTGISQEPSAWV